jgi:branched-chain amino acid transport system substrate-binding protein
MSPARAALVAFTALLAALVPLTGCGSSSEGDARLTIYVSAPLSGPRAADGRDVADGARLALADAGGEAGGVEVRLRELDDAGAGGWEEARTGANARRAAQDSTSIAYVGELDSGASRTSIPITNEAGILQVSPGSGAEDLTREEPGTSGVPPLQSTGERTFGRVIPSDRAQGEAAGAWMAREGAATVRVYGGAGRAGQPDAFADALVAGIEAAPGAPEPVPEGAADASFVVHSEDARRPPASAPVYGSDDLLEPALRQPGPPGAEPLHVVSAALAPSQLPSAAAGFLGRFRDRYGREPGRYAAYGYEATALALDSIGRADDPLDRGSVADAFFATTDRDSILGTYSIDSVGDTTLRALGAYRIGADLRPRPERAPLDLP